MSLNPNEDDILSLCKKLADWDRRNETLLEHMSSLPADEIRIHKWWLALTEAEKLSAEGYELFEALYKLFMALFNIIIESLYERRDQANGLMRMIQMVADTNASWNRGGDGIIDAPLPEPYPIEELRAFVNAWKEQDARVRHVKMELCSWAQQKPKKEYKAGGPAQE